jgi:hypothetical protein
VVIRLDNFESKVKKLPVCLLTYTHVHRPVVADIYNLLQLYKEYIALQKVH